jgi:hypothetical protein
VSWRFLLIPGCSPSFPASVPNCAKRRLRRSAAGGRIRFTLAACARASNLGRIYDELPSSNFKVNGAPNTDESKVSCVPLLEPTPSPPFRADAHARGPSLSGRRHRRRARDISRPASWLCLPQRAVYDKGRRAALRALHRALSRSALLRDGGPPTVGSGSAWKNVFI